MRKMNTNIKTKESGLDSFLNAITLGECIKMKRESLDKTLKEISDEIHVSVSTLSKIETGKLRHPKAVYLFKLSRVLNIQYEVLLELRGFDMNYIKFMDRFGSCE